MSIRASLLLALLATGCGQAATPPAAQPAEPAAPGATALTLTAADGTKVFARLYAAPRPKALILLFHQAGSSKAEYAPIAPRLVADGYSALAVDARAGGDLYGANETVKALGHSADYAAARADLQAAVDWAQGQGVPVLIWGSSYSSALVFPLGAANAGKVAGVLAFSPSEYIGGGDPVKRAAAALKVPVFITSAGDAEEHGAAAAIAARVAPERVTLYRPAAGVHGSSSLRQDRNPRGWQANFAAVEAWLGKVVP